MATKYPFDPLYDENSEVLILGSFPGENSKKEKFYYVDKRNQFWNILSEIYKEDISETNKGRESFLKNIILLFGTSVKNATEKVL